MVEKNTCEYSRLEQNDDGYQEKGMRYSINVNICLYFGRRLS